MTITDQIQAYIDSQPPAKRADMLGLHECILTLKPGCELWFLDGKNGQGKTVANPNIGYGSYTMKNASGKTKDFYQIGLSGNTTGISVYILGLADKSYLAQTYGNTIGKATVTGYCIKFRGLKDIDLQVLKAAINDGFEAETRQV